MSNEDVSVEIIQKTQNTLGKYVKKPPLTDKLLKKPPFRFLHDIIKAVIVETMFLKGLFSEEELKSENFKDKESKIAFLTKLIEAVQSLTNTKLKAKPSKIVAGLEPKETNILLQTIGKAIEKKIDSSDYVNSLKNGNNKLQDKKHQKSTKGDKASIKSSSKTDKTEKKQKAKEIVTPKSTDRSKESSKYKEKKENSKRESSNARTKEAKSTKKENAEPKKTEKNKEESNDEKTKPQEEERLQKEEIIEKEEERPKSRRVRETKQEEQITEKEEIKHEKEDKRKEFNEAVYKNEDLNNSKEEINDKKEEGKKDESKNETRRPISGNRPKSARPKSGDKGIIRPKSSLRPPSVRPSSARPGAPRLRPDSAIPMKESVNFGKINVIVENFDKEPDDEETVIIQNTTPEVDEEPIVIENNENKGHLVEQILEQLNDEVKDEILKFDVYNKEEINKEMIQLRNYIQSLTKDANPLGKKLNYLHEDIESMHAELEMWTNTKNQLYREIEVQNKICNELNQPLIEQLTALNEKIKKQEQEIADIRAVILRNDIKIRQLSLNY